MVKPLPNSLTVFQSVEYKGNLSCILFTLLVLTSDLGLQLALHGAALPASQTAPGKNLDLAVPLYTDGRIHRWAGRWEDEQTGR